MDPIAHGRVTCLALTPEEFGVVVTLRATHPELEPGFDRFEVTALDDDTVRLFDVGRDYWVEVWRTGEMAIRYLH